MYVGFLVDIDLFKSPAVLAAGVGSDVGEVSKAILLCDRAVCIRRLCRDRVRACTKARRVSLALLLRFSVLTVIFNALGTCFPCE